MNIGFIGLGKLGLPCALAIESRGHIVVGMDKSSSVRESIESKTLAYREEGAEELLKSSKIKLLSTEEVVRQSGPAVKVIVGPRMAGYFDLHRCYNALAAFSCGNWLWMFNDDAWVDSACWDTEIAKRGWADEPICLYSRLEWDLDPLHSDYARSMQIYGAVKHYDFPIISRAFYEAMGNYSMSYLNDVYVYEVAVRLGIARDLDGVLVKHTYIRDDTHPPGMNVGEALKPQGRILIQQQVDKAVKKINSIHPK